MTLRDIAAALSAAGIDNAFHEAMLLSEAFTGKSLTLLRISPDEELPMSDALAKAVDKRCERFPLQYILGEWEFMGLPFAVNENCLIPRSDTEILCEYIIKNATPNGRILDLCTGSGCIIAAVLHYRQDLTGSAVELYPETLRMAEENFRKLGLTARIRPILGDVTTDLLPENEVYDVISANPPYVTAEEMEGLEPELSAEPPHALTDGGDGLSILKAILDRYPAHLSENGFMILEHGAAQSESVIQYAKKNGLSALPLKDYGGNIRAAVVRKPATNHQKYPHSTGFGVNDPNQGS